MTCAERLETVWETEHVGVDFPGVYDYEITEPMGEWLLYNMKATPDDFEAELRRLFKATMDAVVKEYIELRPCRILAHETEQCTEAEAHMFGLYRGKPGDCMWVADFLTYEDARRYATGSAMAAGIEFRDCVAIERAAK